MKETNYIIIHNNSWHPAQAFADTVFETTQHTRLLDHTGKPFEYKRQKLGFDLSRKGRG